MANHHGYRSKQRREERATIYYKQVYSKEEIDRINWLVRELSWKDYENGEKVFIPAFQTIIESVLKVQYEGNLPPFAVNHEDGEVLNRFPLRALNLKHFYEYRKA